MGTNPSIQHSLSETPIITRLQKHLSYTDYNVCFVTAITMCSCLSFTCNCNQIMIHIDTGAIVSLILSKWGRLLSIHESSWKISRRMQIYDLMHVVYKPWKRWSPFSSSVSGRTILKRLSFLSCDSIRMYLRQLLYSLRKVGLIILAWHLMCKCADGTVYNGMELAFNGNKIKVKAENNFKTH